MYKTTCRTSELFHKANRTRYVNPLLEDDVFFDQTARFIGQTLDQRDRDPPNLLQNLGGDLPKHMEDLDPE